MLLGHRGHRLLVAFGSADAGRLGLGTGLTTSQLFPRVVTSLAKYDLQQAAAGGVGPGHRRHGQGAG